MSRQDIHAVTEQTNGERMMVGRWQPWRGRAIDRRVVCTQNA